MAYQSVTLDQLVSSISDSLDDQNQVYWKNQEITWAVYESLRYWGALTSYWRTPGTFTAQPYVPSFYGGSPPSPYIDLSVKLPTLRTRTYTLDQMVREIQYMLVEPANGLSGSGMSGQTTVSAILESILYSRNKFVLDTRLPLTVHPILAPGAGQAGMISLPGTCVYTHRATWQDIGGAYTPLWRQDAWSIDRAYLGWTTKPDVPRLYSESESAPLQLQLVPPPIRAGTLQALTVDSLAIDLTNPNSTFNVPDEWVHAIKYAALDRLLSSGQLEDPLRAQYCQKRYQQSVDMAKSATSILRVLVNNIPVPIDSITAVDAACPTWLNQSGCPYMAAVLYDMLALVPALQNAQYGVTVDVAQSAPLPVKRNDYIQIGAEDLENIERYARHILYFKCGGRDFSSTMAEYDGYMAAVAARKGINAAKIMYLEPLFNQPQREWAMRPDKLEPANA